MRQYADAAALAAYPRGEAVPGDAADHALRTASRVVDELLHAIVYDTDDDGLPTDVDIAEAMAEATCAIALEAYTTGALTAGATKQWQQIKVGNVSLGASSTKDAAMVVLGLPVPATALVALRSVGTVGVWVV